MTVSSQGGKMIMQKKKNGLLLGLMSISILLLLVFQFFWIRSEYKSAEESFRRETNLVFRSTVSEILDSMYMTRVELFDSDSTVSVQPRRIKIFDTNDHLALSSAHKALRFDLNKSTLIIKKDSNDHVPEKTHERKEAVKTFIIRLNPDSLDLNTVKSHYNEGLSELGRNVNFRIVEKTPHKINHIDTSYVTSFIQLGSANSRQYAASFEGVPLVLLKQVYPQILFSIILTIFIVAAFIVMFRNLRIQQKLTLQKEDFISNVSHELKTPIATVNVALEAFKNFQVLDNPKKTNEYLDIVKTELDRLTLMTEKILNASVYENKGIQVDNESINLKDVVEEVVKSANPVLLNNDVSVETEYNGAEFYLCGSKIHLTNVLHNLLDNAIKYGKKPAQIIIKLREERENVILEVTDNGIGIPEEYNKKIFEKFFRVPHGDIHNVKGYGLGLNYVSQVVKAHKGSIIVESELGTGSTFMLRFPKNV